MGGWADGRMGRTDAARRGGHPTFLAHGRGKQDRPPGLHARPDERLADRDESREAACIVGDARTLESWAPARHGNIQFRTEHGVQMR